MAPIVSPGFAVLVETADDSASVRFVPLGTRSLTGAGFAACWDGFFVVVALAAAALAAADFAAAALAAATYFASASC